MIHKLFIPIDPPGGADRVTSIQFETPGQGFLGAAKDALMAAEGRASRGSAHRAFKDIAKTCTNLGDWCRSIKTQDIIEVIAKLAGLEGAETKVYMTGACSRGHENFMEKEYFDIPGNRTSETTFTVTSPDSASWIKTQIARHDRVREAYDMKELQNLAMHRTALFDYNNPSAGSNSKKPFRVTSAVFEYPTIGTLESIIDSPKPEQDLLAKCVQSFTGDGDLPDINDFRMLMSSEFMNIGKAAISDFHDQFLLPGRPLTGSGKCSASDCGLPVAYSCSPGGFFSRLVITMNPRV